MLAYGTSPAAAGRRVAGGGWRVAGMVDRVLKGKRPGDMPVERITRHEVVLDLFWVAGKIGVAVPSEVLARADQVVAWSGSARGGVGDDNSGWVLPSGPIHTRWRVRRFPRDECC
jgi:hypothetical protein